MTPTPPRFELCRVPVDSQWEAVIVPVAQLTLDTPMNRRGFLGAGVTASAVLGALTTARTVLAAPFNPGADCGSGIYAHIRDVEALAISPDGKTLVSGGDVGWMKLWRLPDGTWLKTLQGHSSTVVSLAISPDGKILASGDAGGWIMLWSLPDGAVLKTWDGHHDRVASLAISRDGKILASGSFNNSIRLWSLPGGDWIKELKGHTRRVNSLAISPDAKTLASGDDDKSVRLWSLPDGALLKTLTDHTGDGILSLAISRDGKLLASGCRDGSIMLWSLPDGALLKTLTGHTEWTKSMVISPDGKTLASGGGDHSIRLWSLPDGAWLKTLTGHTAAIYSVVFSPDGKTLVSGSGDSSIRLWSLPDGASIRCLIDITSHSLTVKHVTYEVPSPNKYENGRIKYTLSCGSPVPTGASCTCNCVPGSLDPPRPSPVMPFEIPGKSWTESCPGGPVPVPPGATCTCNCVPVCQAHRLLHTDPTVQLMAEELLLHMGLDQFNYLGWAAYNAEPALQARIVQVMAAIETGARPDPKRWPSAEMCFDRLHDADEVVAIMAAQTLYHLHGYQSSTFEPKLQERIEMLLSDARQRPWFVRYSPSGSVPW